jgi:thiol-disulfide isomerase/thioredoxin
MLPLRTKAPGFHLPEPATGKIISLDDFKDAPAFLAVFICNHCPYVKYVQPTLVQVVKEYQSRGLAMVGISANDIASHPQDGPDMMVREAAQAGYTFPYLYDEDQSTAMAYKAACTPDFFLFDRNRELVYRGQIDDSRPGSGIPLTAADLRRALDAVLSGAPVFSEQKPSRGCAIKWKPGNEPAW